MQGEQTRRIGLLTACLLLLLSIAFTVQAEETTEKKGADQEAVAKVNDAAITKQDLEREVSVILQQLSQMGRPVPTGPQLNELKATVLEGLIEGELLYQESQKAGITVNDDDIEEKILGLKSQFPSEVAYKQALDTMQTTEPELKTRLRKSLAIQKLVEQKVGNKIKVDDQTAKAFYEANLDQFKQPEQVKASHILITVDPGADDAAKEAAREKIKSIQKQVTDGEDFAELAKTHSQGPSSVRGGDLGYFRRGQMVKSFEEAAFSMKAGEVSDIVETQFGFHLIKVFDKKPQSVAGYDEMKYRIIDYLKQQETEKTMTAFVEDLKEDAKISRMTPKDQ